MSNFALAANARDVQGKGASRRLRHQAAIPAVIYGGEKPAQSISIISKDFIKCLENEAFYSHIIDLDVDGKNEKVVLKALQRHPVKNAPVHADFLRVEEGRAITVRVPLHYKNQDSCVGVKSQGGRLSILMNEVVVSTLPASLPSAIEIDLAKLESGSTLLLADIPLPAGVSIPALIKPQNKNLPVAKVKAPRGGA